MIPAPQQGTDTLLSGKLALQCEKNTLSANSIGVVDTHIVIG
jgi:hypothetical protein